MFMEVTFVSENILCTFSQLVELRVFTHVIYVAPTRSCQVRDRISRPTQATGDERRIVHGLIAFE
jgi:hypothetical protein